MTHDTQSCTAEVVAKREVIPGTFYIVLKAPLLAASSRAGQFIMIQTRSGSDPLLRRPISLCGAGGETVAILFQVRGTGTGIMASWEPGHSVSVLGPFGNGFMVPADLQTAVLVAGGIGAAPLLFLAKSLSAEFQYIKSIFFFGSRNQADSALLTGASDHMQAPGFIHVTEDGSTEHAGLVTDAFKFSVSRGELGAGRTCIYSCGPAPMLKRVARIAAAYGIPCQVSLEAHMACGVGACLGCVVEAKGGFKRVCADGPVFDSRALGWNYD
jgi:dihydroorotate dehydrogenase electron transfer subunit